MKSFLKSSDFLYKDFKTSSNNSEFRGGIVVTLIISFLSVNLYFLHTNAYYPKPNKILDAGNVKLSSFDHKSVKINFKYDLKEMFHKDEDRNDFTCKPYLATGNFTDIPFTLISPGTQLFEYSIDIDYNYSNNHFFDPLIYLKYICKKDFQKISSKSFPDITLTSYLNHNIVYTPLILKNITESYYDKDQNNDKISIFKNSISKQKLKFSLTKYSKYHYSSNLFVSYYDNNKELFEFNSDFSNYLQNNYLKNNDFYINAEDTVLETNESSLQEIKSEEGDVFAWGNNVLLGYIIYDINLFPRLFVICNNYVFKDFTFIVSVFSVIYKMFFILNTLVLMNYKYFDFINKNCHVSFERKDDYKYNCIRNNFSNKDRKYVGINRYSINESKNEYEGYAEYTENDHKNDYKERRSINSNHNSDYNLKEKKEINNSLIPKSTDDILLNPNSQFKKDKKNKNNNNYDIENTLSNNDYLKHLNDLNYTLNYNSSISQLKTVTLTNKKIEISNLMKENLINTNNATNAAYNNNNDTIILDTGNKSINKSYSCYLANNERIYFEKTDACAFFLYPICMTRKRRTKYRIFKDAKKEIDDNFFNLTNNKFIYLVNYNHILSEQNKRINFYRNKRKKDSSISVENNFPINDENIEVNKEPDKLNYCYIYKIKESANW